MKFSTFLATLLVTALPQSSFAGVAPSDRREEATNRIHFLLEERLPRLRLNGDTAARVYSFVIHFQDHALTKGGREVRSTWTVYAQTNHSVVRISDDHGLPY